MFKWFLRSIACLSLLSCGTIDISTLKKGEFKGSLFVMWVGEGGSSGDGQFVFVPAPGAPLTFHRTDPRSKVTTITPGMMYTDGGSIPRIGQIFEGFNPWGYAPAYMVHDWVFRARQCLNDGSDQPEYLAIADMDFNDSAYMMGEAIRTLIDSGKVKKNEIAPHVITNVVKGQTSRNLWNLHGECENNQVSKKHRDEVNAALARRAGLRTLQRGVKPAQILTVIDFSSP